MNSQSIPDYWKKPLENAAAKISANASAGAQTGFFFFTDLHISANHCRSGDLIAALSGATGIKTALCGGDFTPAFADGFPTDEAALADSVDKYLERWVHPLDDAGIVLLTAKGNHDFTIRHAIDSEDGFTLPVERTRAAIMASNAARRAVTDAQNPEVCCHYFDDTAAKMRYVIADTTDSSTTARRYWTTVDGIHEPQLLWLAESAFGTVPRGWNVVVMQHIPIAGCTANAGEINLFAPFRTLLEAFQNRKVWTCGGRTFDFSMASGHIAIDLSGHHHAEREAFCGNILYATEPCDAAYEDYSFGSPLCGSLPLKEPGTPFEQTFDCIQPDTRRSLVYFTRIGGGQDKVIHTGETILAPGEVRRFETSVLAHPTRWETYDSDAFFSRDNPRNRWSKLVSYRSTRLSCSGDGTVTALQEGPAMVVALDKNLNKEIFPIFVTPKG